ncbi:MAG: mechanosensitive ion channel [Gammaproteobacteria bacterium]|nr:mechanosensitive ion channel [Gammaproteobacteria bacterium]
MMIDFITNRGVDFAINLISAIAIFVIGRWIVKLVKRLLVKMMTKAAMEETLIGFLSGMASNLLLAFVIIAAIERLGVNTTSFAAIIAAAGLAVGLALQGSLSNFASGVLLILFKPFKKGDFVTAAGSSGTVEEIRIFNTIMKTGDNIRIIIPNSAITGGTITNFSANETRRIDLVIGCGYNDDLKAVKAYLEELVQGDERILAEPAPVVAVNELGDSSVNFVVRPWVKSSDYWGVRWDLTEAVKIGFEARGFTIPYPSQDIHLHQA